VKGGFYVRMVQIEDEKDSIAHEQVNIKWGSKEKRIRVTMRINPWANMLMDQPPRHKPKS
jgi:hypothetical protein